MNSIVLQTAARTLLTLVVVVMIFVLWRGHNEPGGGFIAGLGITAAIVLYAFAFGSDAAVKLLPFDPRVLAGVGLLLALSAGLLGFAAGDTFLAGQWVEINWWFISDLKLGSPLLFDLGVACVVLGSAIALLVSLLEDS